MDRSQYLTVSELTKYLKMKFDRDPYLHTVYLIFVYGKSISILV